MISGTTGVAAVIGHPVAHSLSPALHNAAFAELGLDWVYVAFDVAPGRVPDALAGMAALGVRGLSVTMPHKEAVAEYLAARGRLSPSAAALRSVNTVAVGSDGVLEGDSTDGAGLVASLEASGVAVAGASVCLVGGGGAARAIADALARSGVAQVLVHNRTKSAAAATADIAAALGVDARVVGIGDTAAIAAADIIVNATSVGMGVATAAAPPGSEAERAAMAVDPAVLRGGHVVVDIVYHPRRTVLLAAAERAGAATVDGLGMLVHQAVLQHERWHGRRPDERVMAAAAEHHLRQRELDAPRQ
ncbi:MAG: shikimate dehydrogenase [Ilumatobacteraceae bacterium]